MSYPCVLFGITKHGKRYENKIVFGCTYVCNMPFPSLFELDFMAAIAPA